MLKLLFTFLISCVFTSSLSAEMTYRIKSIIKLDVEQLPTVNINNDGVVCGHTIDGPHRSSIFIYSHCNDELLLLNAFDSECSRLLSLNNRNEILGYYYDEGFSSTYGRTTQVIPFIWSKEKGFVSLRSSLGRIVSTSPFAKINDLGWIAGYGFADSIFDFYTNEGQFKTHYSSIIWKQQKDCIILNHNLQNNFGVCIKSINNKGDAAGGIFYGSGQHSDLWNPAYAFLWDSAQKRIMPIGNLGGQDKFYSCATDINDKKQVIGCSEIDIKKTGHSRHYYHAFLWDRGAMFDLGALDTEEEEDSIARAINARGDIVGKSGNFDWNNSNNKAFLWTNKNGMIDLNSCIDSDMNYKLYEAFDINDDGWIICLAEMNREMHIVLLIPETSNHQLN